MTTREKTKYAVFLKLKKLRLTLLGVLWICFASCEKTEIIPITGTYVGNTQTEKWEFIEILDNDGNMVGIEEKRDTLVTQQDIFTLTQVGKGNMFTISGSGGLARINGLSNHEFSYTEPESFVLVETSNGVETKRFEFTFDASSKVSLFYIEDGMDSKQRPRGQKITFSGVKE